MRQGVALWGGNWRAGGWPRGRAGMVCGVAPLALAAGVIVPLAALCRGRSLAPPRWQCRFMNGSIG